MYQKLCHKTPKHFWTEKGKNCCIYNNYVLTVYYEWRTSIFSIQIWSQRNNPKLFNRLGGRTNQKDITRTLLIIMHKIHFIDHWCIHKHSTRHPTFKQLWPIKMMSSLCPTNNIKNWYMSIYKTDYNAGSLSANKGHTQRLAISSTSSYYIKKYRRNETIKQHQLTIPPEHWVYRSSSGSPMSVRVLCAHDHGGKVFPI